MYGDTSVMRKRAGELRDQGADIALTADHLVAQSDAIDLVRPCGRRHARPGPRARDAPARGRGPARDGRRVADPPPRRGRPAQGVHRRRSSSAPSRSSPTPAPGSPGSRPRRRRTRPAAARVSPSEADETLAAFVPPQARPQGLADRDLPDCDLPRTERSRPDGDRRPHHPAPPAREPPRRAPSPGGAHAARAAHRRAARRRRSAALRRDRAPARGARGPDGPEPGLGRGRRLPRRGGGLCTTPSTPWPAAASSTATPSTPAWPAPSACSPPRPSPSTSTSASTTCRPRPGTARPTARSRPWPPSTASSSSWPGSTRRSGPPSWAASPSYPRTPPLGLSAFPSHVDLPFDLASGGRRGRPHRTLRPAPGAGHPSRRPRRRRRGGPDRRPRRPRPAARAVRRDPRPAARPGDRRVERRGHRRRRGVVGAARRRLAGAAARTTTATSHGSRCAPSTPPTWPPSWRRSWRRSRDGTDRPPDEETDVDTPHDTAPTSTTGCSGWPRSSTPPARRCAPAPSSGETVLRDAEVAASEELSPKTYAQVEEDVRHATTGKRGLLARSIELDADALMIRATVLTYRWIDDLQEAAYKTLGAIAGRAIGYLAPEVALGGAIVSAGLIETDALDRDGGRGVHQRAGREQPRAARPRLQRRRRAARQPADARRCSPRACWPGRRGQPPAAAGCVRSASTRSPPTAAPRCATSPARSPRRRLPAHPRSPPPPTSTPPRNVEELMTTLASTTRVDLGDQGRQRPLHRLPARPRRRSRRAGCGWWAATTRPTPPRWCPRSSAPSRPTTASRG